MKKLKFLGILLIGLLLLASPANATGYRMIMMAGGVEAADGGNDAYAKLLMHMEGTDDAQVFTDSSVGNLVKVDAGTGFSDAFGVFDGTGDYLQLPDHADWDFGTGDLTYEAWVYANNYGVYNMIIGTDQYPSYFAIDNGGLKFSADGVLLSASGTSVPLKTWTHVAVVRDSGDTELFIDGVSVGTRADQNGDWSSITDIEIGRSPYYTSYEWEGYLDEVRISNIARYTSNFTPSTTNFVSDANTKLLLHMDLPNTDPQSFVDSGNTGHTVTDNGGVYQKARNLGIIGTSCGYFDGTGDYLTILDHADWDFDTGDCTIECWVKSTDTFYAIWGDANGAADDWDLLMRVSGSEVDILQGATTHVTTSSDGILTDGSWHHIAFVHDLDGGSGHKQYVFIDGVQRGYSDTALSDRDNGAARSIGNANDDGGWRKDFLGYMDELRISNTARYTADFNPPTTAFTSDANTKLLLHFDGGEGSVAFTDSGNTTHTVTANGNAIQVIGHGADAAGNVKTENTAYKFGSTSAYFDGTGDYISLAGSNDWDIGANADSYTVDFWVRFDTHAGTEQLINTYGIDSKGWFLRHGHGVGFTFGIYNSAWIVLVEGGGEITDSDWHHVALVKDVNDYDIYVDGTSVNSATDSDRYSTSNSLTIGDSEGSSEPFTGYIDELRISKGIARWTANFTPPNAAYYE